MLAGLLLTLFSAGSIDAMPLPDAEDYDVLGRGTITVYHYQSDSKMARQYLEWAVAYNPRPQWLTSLHTLAGLSIYVAPTDEQFQELSGGQLPEWGVACAIPGTDVVIVRSPRIVEIWSEPPREILNHEITHIYLEQLLAGADVPRWFHEGYALYASRMWGMDSFFSFSVAVLMGRSFALGDLEKGFPAGREQAELAYLQSYTVVEYMFEHWNDDQMRLLFDRWRSTGDLDTALRTSLGLTLGRMEDKWREWVEVRYGWLRLLTSATLMWIAAAVLFLVVFARRRCRNRRKLEDMRRRETLLIESSLPAGKWRQVGDNEQDVQVRQEEDEGEHEETTGWGRD